MMICTMLTQLWLRQMLLSNAESQDLGDNPYVVGLQHGP